MQIDCPQNSNILVSQFVPVYPSGHMQQYELTPSTHVPPFRQGHGVQSSISEYNS